MSYLLNRFSAATARLALVATVLPAMALADSAPPEWVALYESPLSETNGSPFDSVAGLAVDPHGNVYAAASGEDLNGRDQIVVLKYDSAGNLLWETPFRGGDRAAADGIALDGAGNVIVIGTDRYILGTPEDPPTGADIATIKLDPEGNLLWSARYTQPRDSSDAPEDFAVNRAGQVYVTGLSYNEDGNLDYVTIKYDADGTELWVRRHDGPASHDDRPSALALDPAGNVLVTGYTTAFCFIDDDDDEACITDMTTISYAPDGTTNWIQNFDGPTGGTDRGQAITTDRFGNVYVAGITVDTSFAPRWVTVKYSRRGHLRWTAFEAEQDNFTGPSSLVVDRRGQVYVAGGAGFSVVKYSRRGEASWRQDLQPGFVEGIALDAHGNVGVGGRFQDESRTFYTAAKLDPQGNLLWCGAWDRDTGGRQISRTAAFDRIGNIYVGGYSFGDVQGDPAAATVKFAPPPPPPVIDVFAAQRHVIEGGNHKTGLAAFVLRRRGDTSNELTVHYETDGTATNGSDYEFLDGAVTFPAGRAWAMILVMTIDDAEVEPSESVIIQLQPSAAEAYRIGDHDSATIVILDDDATKLPWPWPWWSKLQK